MTGALEVLDAGTFTSVQDGGRHGYAHLGVPRSGAVDLAAAREANLLVGNAADAAVLEVAATGCALRATGPMLVAVTGAECSVFVGSIPAPLRSPVRLAAGQVLELLAPERGMRNYVAVRGGVEVEPVLGSRSTDTLSGLGPPVVAAGDRLPVGAAGQVTDEEFARLRALRGTSPSEPAGGWTMPVRLGPRHEWLTEAALAALTSTVFTVSADSNRVGLRLEGAALERAREGELVSEPMVLGAVQVPPSGQPVVFLADHPTTGGYPVIGVVDRQGLAVAAQARPGDRLRFSLIEH